MRIGGAFLYRPLLPGDQLPVIPWSVSTKVQLSDTCIKVAPYSEICMFHVECSSRRLSQESEEVVSCFRQLGSDLSFWRPGFNHGSSFVRFVVDSVIHGHVSLQILLFSPLRVIPLTSHSYLLMYHQSYIISAKTPFLNKTHKEKDII